MAWMRLQMDGVTYQVRIVYNTLARAFSILEGANAGTMISGRDERDLIGTKYTYEMAIEPDPMYQSDYDAFYEAISEPVPSHQITVPYGQGVLTYEAAIVGGKDAYDGILSGVKQWGGLTVQFKAIKCQRVPT